MIERINEMIEKYTLYAEESESYKGILEIVSDLEELKKLAEEDRSRMEDYWKYKKLRSEGHSIGCATDMALLNAECRCDVNKDNNS